MFNIAVVGATGATGSALLKLLENRTHLIKNLYLYSQMPNKVSFKNHNVNTIPLDPDNLPDIDFLFTCAGSSVTKSLEGKVSKNTWWIDKTSYFRQKPGIPLIVPELNAQEIKENTRIIACPNCVAIPASVALQPLIEKGIEHCFMSTYQSISGAGKTALKAFSKEQRNFELSIMDENLFFKKNMYLNVVPAIDTIHDNEWSEEELKIHNEINKIHNQTISINSTCVRVPVRIGHSISMSVVLKNQMSVSKLLSAYKKIPSVFAVSESGKFFTPREAAGEYPIFISRVRANPDNPKIINMWITCDNTLKGASLNSIEILDYIADKFYNQR